MEDGDRDDLQALGSETAPLEKATLDQRSQHDCVATALLHVGCEDDS